jgi:hypothetical protein
VRLQPHHFHHAAAAQIAAAPLRALALALILLLEWAAPAHGRRALRVEVIAPKPLAGCSPQPGHRALEKRGGLTEGA